MKKLSVGSWAYTIGPYEKKPVDFYTVCRKLKELNFDGVELGGFPPHPNPDDMPDKEQRDEVKEKVREIGLEFSGLAANLWDEKLINTDDQSKYISEFKKNCVFCNDLGISTIRVDCVQPPTILDEMDYDTAFKRVTETWKTCSDIAGDHGLNVAWEFEPGFAFNKPSEVVKVIDTINKDNFGAMYDTCHGQMVAVNGSRQPGEKEILPGGQVELINMLDGKINHLHLIDSDNTCHKDADGNDETSAHPPFGKGVINFDEIMPLLAKQPVPHDFWTMDLCFYPEAWEATAEASKFLRELSVKYG